jgi:hypothetical protein
LKKDINELVDAAAGASGNVAGAAVSSREFDVGDFTNGGVTAGGAGERSDSLICMSAGNVGAATTSGLSLGFFLKKLNIDNLKAYVVLCGKNAVLLRRINYVSGEASLVGELGS